MRLAQETLEGFKPVYAEALGQGMERKLGLTPGDARNADFIERLWPLLERGKADFTLFFRRLTQFAGGADEAGLSGRFVADVPAGRAKRRPPSSPIGATLTPGDDLAARLRAMQGSNPIVIARNHRVEQALARASEGDLALLIRLRRAEKSLSGASTARAAGSDLEAPPRPEERVLETFCGT